MTLTAFHKKTQQTTEAGVERDSYGRLSGGANPPNLFGRRYKDLASRLFPGIESAEEVLMRHTLVGFYGGMLTAANRAAWLSNLASHSSTVVATEYLDGRICGPLSVAAQVKKPLRLGPGCVDVDLDDRGLAEWKVLHQLPFLMHCVEHGQLLRSSSSACGRCPVNHPDIYRLPSDPCPNCEVRPARSDRETRRGQLLLGHLCARIFKGEVPEVEPHQWQTFARSIVKRPGGTDHATVDVHALLVQLGDVDSAQDILRLRFSYSRTHLVLFAHADLVPNTIRDLFGSTEFALLTAGMASSQSAYFLSS